MLAIPADAPPRQLAGVAGILLLERAFDAPVVRQVERPPGMIVKRGLYQGDVFTRMTAGRSGEGDGVVRYFGSLEIGARRFHERFDVGELELLADLGRLLVGEPPLIIERNAFANRRLLRERSIAEAGKRDQCGGNQTRSRGSPAAPVAMELT